MRTAERTDLKKFTLFGDISGSIVFSSDKIMFLLAEIPPREIVPEHSHPHEQMGICLRGRAEFRAGEEKKTPFLWWLYTLQFSILSPKWVMQNFLELHTHIFSMTAPYWTPMMRKKTWWTAPFD